MGWAMALFGRLTKQSSNRKSSSDYPPPVFAVDRTEVAVTTEAVTGVPELTLRELNKATRSFSASMVIGQGQSDMVYRATLPIGNGGMVAAAVAKRLGLPPSGDESLRQLVLVLSRLRHDNLVRMLGYTIDTTAHVRVLLFEYADMGTLHDVLHGAEPSSSSSSRRPALSWAQRTGIALDVARGLEYLHDGAAMSHWGIRSSKVLLFLAQAGGFRAKIDYDLFKQLQRPPELNARVILGKETCYEPPEYSRTGHRSSSKFDVFSYGVLLLELLTGKNCCAVRSCQMEWADPILSEGRVEHFMDPKLGTQYPPARALKLARMALCCVQDNPRSRPSMSEVAQIMSCHIVSSETTMAE